MILLVFYSFCAYGFAWVIGHSKLSLVYRNPLSVIAFLPVNKLSGVMLINHALAKFFLSLFECVGCTGFWIGFAFSFSAIANSLLSGAIFFKAMSWGTWTVASNLLLGKLTGLTDE